MTTVSASIEDILILRDLARKFLSELDESERLPTLDRDLSFEERIALAFLNASLTILNKSGAIKEGWIAENRVEMLPPDWESIQND